MSQIFWSCRLLQITHFKWLNHYKLVMLWQWQREWWLPTRHYCDEMIPFHFEIAQPVLHLVVFNFLLVYDIKIWFCHRHKSPQSQKNKKVLKGLMWILYDLFIKSQTTKLQHDFNNLFGALLLFYFIFRLSDLKHSSRS